MRASLGGGEEEGERDLRQTVQSGGRGLNPMTLGS